ncbi:MAG: hypothetical protein JXB05_23120 [Myxococcaceae bacterium]|nr:hypothetical protein [Myxococcaceae bacterium]
MDADGNEVPDHPKLAQLWRQNMSLAVTGEQMPQGAMDEPEQPAALSRARS